MHDDLNDPFERRLRSVLREEARSIPFLITAAELERRAVLRGRRGPARLTLLLAAAVTIGALGAGALLGGLATTPDASPTAPVTAIESSRPGPEAARTLPTLDELFAANRAPVLIAQAHGPADGSAEQDVPLPGAPFPSTHLGVVYGGSDYLIAAACLGVSPDVTLRLDIRRPGQRGPAGPTGPDVPCDGTVVETSVRLEDAADVSVRTTGSASWRVVVRGNPASLPQATANPVLPPAEAGRQALVDVQLGTVESGFAWGTRGWRIEEAGVVSARLGYGASIWCPSGSELRLVFGSEAQGEITPTTETHLACDGLVHDLWQGIASPHGSPVFVAAAPGTQYSLLVTSDAPPIELLSEKAGWELTSGFGPSLSFDDMPHGVSGIGPEGGGRVAIGFVCAGTQGIAVTIELGEEYGERRDRFIAACTPEGATTFREFEIPSPAATLTFVERPGTWTAVSFFVPSDLRALGD